jgi:hypothetical protein
MMLVKYTASFFVWLATVMQSFIQSNSALTVKIVAISVAARIVNIVAFLLPLKVILLAGSERIPRYFPFIDQAHRTEWIVALSVGAVILYLVTLVLDSVRRNLAEAGGSQMLRASTAIFVNSSQEDDVKSVYLRVVTVVTNIIFFLTGMVVITLLDKLVVLFLSTYLGAAYLIFAGLTSRRAARRAPALAANLDQNFKKYVRIASSVGFLTSFLVILYTLLTAAEANVAIAIVLIILLRQVLSAATGVVIESVQMSRRRDQFNAMLFREHQWREAESKDTLSLREAFNPNDRAKLVAAEIGQFVDSQKPIKVQWIDPAYKGIQCFDIQAKALNGSSFRAIQTVYRPTQRHLLANEDYLFSFMNRKDLGAPAVIGEFTVAGYVSRIVAADGSIDLPRNKWRQSLSQVLGKMWSVRPSDELAEGYRATHRLLEERLDRSLLQKLAVAIDLDTERTLYHTAIALLPRIRSRLSRLPLIIVNPDLSRTNALFVPDDAEVRPIFWGKWQLARLGSDLSLELSDTVRNELLRNIQRGREDARDITIADYVFCQRCAMLERHIEQSCYKAAFDVISDMLKAEAQESRPTSAIA